MNAATYAAIPLGSRVRARIGGMVAKVRRIKNGHVTSASALQHLRVFHPGTPQAHAREIAERIGGRTWERATLGKIVGIVMTNYVRHELTEYERLLRIPGMTREEARMLVHEDVADVLAAWAVGPPPSHSEPGP